jgi:hypothetical protein
MKKLLKQIIAFLKRVYRLVFGVTINTQKQKQTIYMSKRTKKRIKNAKQQNKAPSYGMTFYVKSKGVKRKTTLYYPKAKAA